VGSGSLREWERGEGEVREGAGSASLSLSPVRSRAAIGQPATTLDGEIRARPPALDAAAAPADGATLADSTVGTPDVDGHQLKLRAAGGRCSEDVAVCNARLKPRLGIVC
jgi:hypothetical protein